jgi:hypothetical protein
LTSAVIALLLLPVERSLPSPPAPLDTLMDVGGYHLHLVVYRGTRPLTIVRHGIRRWSVARGVGPRRSHVPEKRPEAIVQAVLSLTAQFTGSDAR